MTRQRVARYTALSVALCACVAAGSAVRAAHQDAALPHTLEPLQVARGFVHRFTVPLARAALSFVDLHYELPLVDMLGSHTLIFNGGYWAYAGKRKIIQGLVIVNDVKHAPKVPARGGVLEVHAGKARMVASEAYEPRPGTTLAMQCSPRLVDKGRVIPKLDTLRRAARTALCVGDDTSQLRVYLTDAGTRPTLAQFADFLQRVGCVQALNLDGGPSTAASAQGEEEPILIGRGTGLPYGIAVDLREP